MINYYSSWKRVEWQLGAYLKELAVGFQGIDDYSFQFIKPSLRAVFHFRKATTRKWMLWYATRPRKPQYRLNKTICRLSGSSWRGLRLCWRFVNSVSFLVFGIFTRNSRTY